MLVAIIETVTGKKLGDVYREYIFSPAGMEKSYAFHDIIDEKPAAMYYKKKQVHAPEFIASSTADGGVVSTAEEMMRFNKAYFNGLYFPEKWVEEQMEWRMIYFPGAVLFRHGT